jgi:hypothetical protein
MYLLPRIRPFYSANNPIRRFAHPLDNTELLQAFVIGLALWLALMTALVGLLVL